MKITDFSQLVSRREGGRVNLTIAQIAEVLRITNEATRGWLYWMIRLMPEGGWKFRKPAAKPARRGK